MIRRRTVGVAVIVLVCALPVAVYLASLPLSVRFAGAAASVTAVAVACGLAGFAAFGTNLILGSRFRTVERAVGGLDAMYDLHRGLGRVAFLLLAAHAVGIVAGRALSSWPSAAALFDPSNGFAPLIGVVALLAMAIAIGFTLYGNLEHETFVYVQRTFGAIFLLGALHAFRTPGAKATSVALTYVLAFVAVAGIAAWIRRSVIGDALIRRHDYRVARLRPVAGSVVEIEMVPRDGMLSFVPGQFVFVTFTSEEMTRRFHPFGHFARGGAEVITLRPGERSNQFHPFSITSGRGDESLRVAVKAVGDYTSAMHAMEGGARARVEGPYGSFSYLNVKSRRQIWVAGGIGITPFLGMARSLTEDEDFDIDLYFAVKTRSEAYFHDELAAIADRHGGLRLTLYPEDERGFITAEKIRSLSGSLNDLDVLLCGPPVMIDALESQFVAAGVARRRIHYERFRFGP